MQTLKTKVFTCLLSLVMVFSLVPGLNSNAANISNGLSYKVSGGVLTIQGTGDMPDYVLQKDTKTGAFSTTAPWFSSRSNIRKIVIEPGVSYVGKNSFAYLTSVTDVEFQSTGSLKKIGDQAFYYCSALKNLVLPKGLVTIGRYTFGYTGVTTVSFPASLKTIGTYSFYDCTKLTKVSIPSGVTAIGEFAFYGDYNITSVTGGSKLQTIGKEAFAHCWGLKYFKVTSKKLKKIGLGAFVCDSKLKTIYIKNTTKLTKKGVRGSLYLSSVKTVRVKKSKVKKYKKYFKYSNSGKTVKVKK